MQKIIITFLCVTCFILTACTKLSPYQPNVQQGNLIYQTPYDRLQPGMSRDQVVRLMGNPVLENVIASDHWAYVYTFQPRGGAITKKRIDVYFQNGRVTRIDKQL